MENCQNKNIGDTMSGIAWDTLMKLPAFRYMKAPVNTEAELYEKYPDGNEAGSFSYVKNENTFYIYHPRGWKYGEWVAIASDGSSSFFEIEEEFLKEGDILVYDSSRNKFVIKTSNIWNKIFDTASSLLQTNRFLNHVKEIPTNENNAGVYFVQNGISEFSALYLVLGKQVIKIYQSSDFYTAQEVQDKLDKKANQDKLNDDLQAIDIKINSLKNIGVRKIYSSYNDMLGDRYNPIGTNNLPILDGQLVLVSNVSDTSKDGLYVFYSNSHNSEWLYAGGAYIAGEISRKTDQSNFYNISQANADYVYPDKQTARKAVPLIKRAKGQIITYQISDVATTTTYWITEQFIGNDIVEWQFSEEWSNISFGGSPGDPHLLSEINYDNAILPIIADSDNKLLFGWNKDDDKPIIPKLIRSLINTINYDSLDQALKDKLNEINLLNSLISLDSNDDWLLAAIDAENKVLWGINKDKKMFLAGQVIGENNYVGYTQESDEKWIIRFTDADNKVIWGIDRENNIYPTGYKIDEIKSKLNSTDRKIAELTDKVNSKDNNPAIGDVNYKGYYETLNELTSKYTPVANEYVSPTNIFKPTLLENDKSIIGNSDQRQWYANVGGYFAYVRWSGENYEWFLSDVEFKNKSTLGMKIAIYDGRSFDCLEDEIKQAYLTNSVTIATTPAAIIKFNPDILIYPNCGYYAYKSGKTLTEYLSLLRYDLPQYINKIPLTNIVFYSAPNIDAGYKEWINPIRELCEEYSIQFINLTNQSGINEINKNKFLLDDITLNRIGSKRIAHRTLTEANSTERVGFSTKQSIPVIYIDTENGDFFDEKDRATKMKMTRFEVDVRNSGLKGFEGTLVQDKDEIRGRGNSTWLQPKKPYRLKFDKKVSFFGFPSEKNWVLLACYLDKSSIRPSLGHKLGEHINKYRLDNGEANWYCPTEQLVELVINGRYDGLYCFTDHVTKVSNSRVNIPEPTPQDIATLTDKGHYELNNDIEIPVSGGFLIELEPDWKIPIEGGVPIVDKNNIVTGSTGDVYVRSDYGTVKRYFCCKTLEFYKKDLVTTESPNGVVLQSYMNYIQNFISKVNYVLMGSTEVIGGKTYKERISEYIDINSFIDYFFVMEVLKNPDAQDFSSIFYNKDRDRLVDGTVVISPLKAGPIWDVDLAAGNSRNDPNLQKPDGWFVRYNPWTNAMLRDAEIKQMYIDRWNNINFGSMWSDTMDELVTKAYDAAQRDNVRWSINDVPYFKTTLNFCPTLPKYYEIELAYLRSWMNNRINWINNNINNI